MTETTPSPLTDISPETLFAMLRRSMRNAAIVAVVLGAGVWIGSGWRNAAMIAVGAAISVASIWEWLRLARLINARLDKQKSAASTGVVVLFFFIRLFLFAGVIYGSLKVVHGSGVALLCGLALAVTTLGWEALKMLRE